MNRVLAVVAERRRKLVASRLLPAPPEEGRTSCVKSRLGAAACGEGQNLQIRYANVKKWSCRSVFVTNVPQRTDNIRELTRANFMAEHRGGAIA